MTFIQGITGTRQNKNSEEKLETEKQVLERLVDGMHVIGITGGIGAGKSEVLKIIKESCNCCILLADEVAHLVKEPGGSAYEKLVELLGKEILQPDKRIDKQKMADKIFRDRQLLQQVNELIHPAVEEYILKEIRQEKSAGKKDFFFVESALLLESKLKSFMDEIWYIYADQEVRKKRLKENRQYTEEKTEQIFKVQRKESEFEKECAVRIDNSGDIEITRKQIKKKLGEYL